MENDKYLLTTLRAKKTFINSTSQRRNQSYLESILLHL